MACSSTCSLAPASSSSTFLYGMYLSHAHAFIRNGAFVNVFCLASFFCFFCLFAFFCFLACFPSHRLPRRPFSHPGPTSHAHAFIRNGAFVFGLGTLILYVLFVQLYFETLERAITENNIPIRNTISVPIFRLW